MNTRVRDRQNQDETSFSASASSRNSLFREGVGEAFKGLLQTTDNQLLANHVSKPMLLTAKSIGFVCQKHRF